MSHRPFHPSEIGGEGDGSTSSDIVEVARELERLDSGVLRPSEGFTDRVLAAIADEPLPRPMAVAGLAAREGRVGAHARGTAGHLACRLVGRPSVGGPGSGHGVRPPARRGRGLGRRPGHGWGDQRPLPDEQLAGPHAAHEGAGRDALAPAGRADPDRQAGRARRTHRDGRTPRDGQADRDSGADRDTGADETDEPHPTQKPEHTDEPRHTEDPEQTDEPEVDDHGGSETPHP